MTDVLKILLTLSWEFFKTGLLSIGGGLATIPFLREIANTYDWFDVSEITDMIAISESTPGAMGINMSTYAGFHSLDDYGLLASLLGALVATLSIICPSIIVIMIVAKILDRFKSSPLVKKAFFSLRPASAGLILGAMFDIFVSSLLNIGAFSGFTFTSIISCINWINIIIFTIMLVVMNIKKCSKIHPVIYIVSGAVLGVVFSL